jgi:Bax protein
MTKHSTAALAQARSRTSARSAARSAAESGAQRNSTWALFSLSVLAAAGAFGAGYEPFRHALEDRYGLSIFVRMTDENTFERPDSAARPPVAVMFLDNSVKRVSAVFDTQEFNLAAVRRGARVPRVFVAALPQDIDQLRTVNDKRNTFIRAMLPMILAVNERIAAERRYLIDLKRRTESGETLPPLDEAWIRATAERYKVTSRGKRIDWATLLERVDVVPPSLALAQSIVETGWGTSAPARKSNALFGMIGGDGTDTAKLAAFENLYASVAAYVHNLNTYLAYGDFRKQRAALRVEGKSPEGRALAMTLQRYSELGLEYTRHIQAVIEKESLAPFDDAQLSIGRGNEG